MSTKAIESVLKWVLQGDAHSDAPEAMKELEAIRKACRDYSDGTDYWEPVTSGASDAVELFRRIGQEESK